MRVIFYEEYICFCNRYIILYYVFRFIYFIGKVLISHEKIYYIILVTGTYFAKLIFHIEDKWDDSLRFSSIIKAGTYRVKLF